MESKIDPARVAQAGQRLREQAASAGRKALADWAAGLTDRDIGDELSRVGSLMESLLERLDMVGEEHVPAVLREGSRRLRLYADRPLGEDES